MGANIKNNVWFFLIFSAEKSIEVIDIDPTWLPKTSLIVVTPTSSIVAQLPKDLFGAATLVHNEELTFIGGQQLSGASNYDIIVFNVATNLTSTLGSQLSTDIQFGQDSYILETGQL